MIQNGLAVDSSTSPPIATTGDPKSPFTRADNLHLRSFAGETPDIEGPTTLGHPGCPECVHMHWRWSSLLDRYHFPGILVAGPLYDNNKGKPIIPPGSNQDVDVAILKANIGGGNDTEEHPAFGKTYLSYVATPQTINDQVPLSFWYSSTGHSSNDLFLKHGGFFSSLRVTIRNPYSVSASLGLVTLPFQTGQACDNIAQLLRITCTVFFDIQNRTGHQIK